MKPVDYITDELKQVAPYLASLPRVQVFAVPPDYFESLPVMIVRSLDTPFANNLAAVTSPLPFEVPEEYFEKLPSAILSAIKNQEISAAENKSHHSVVKPLYKYRMWLAAASVAALFILSVMLVVKNEPEKINAEITVPDTVNSELLYAAELDEAMVVEMYLQQHSQAEGYNAVAPDETDDDHYLREASEIDAAFINEL